MLLNSKIDKYSYKEDISNIDSYPYTKPIFSRGWNSVVMMMLGFLSAHEPMIIPFFLGYELYKYRPYDSTITDIEEYTIGFIAGSIIPVESMITGKKKNDINPLLYNLFDLNVV
jgi:hypothetical protein